MDRVVEIKHHPIAKDLLLTLSEDRGNPTARLWRVATGDLLLLFELPKGGISSAAWSPDGQLLAVATKNKQVHVFDPRDVSGTITSSASHESIRPVRLAWAADRRLLSTGFTRSASRELLLFAVDDKKLAQIGKTSLDISPAALFPFVDLDTRIALLYSRGDRSCLAFELDLDPQTPQQAFTKLPSFEHASLQVGFAFMPKAHVDVKAVEIVRALRLTQKEVEVVSFGIPRAKASLHPIGRSFFCSTLMPPLAFAGRLLPERHFCADSQRREARVGCGRVDQRQECNPRALRLAPGRDENLCVNSTVAAVLPLADLRSAHGDSVGSTGTRQERQHPLKGRLVCLQ